MPNPSRFIDFIAGESVRERICRVVRGCSGLSLSSRRDELEALVARGVDETEWAREVVRWTTNCGTSALGVLASACGSVDAARAVHPLLARRSINGLSIAWLMQIGWDTGAWTAYHGKTGAQPAPGDLLRYQTQGKNDDHVEWLLGPIDTSGEAEHGGGGRPDNAMSTARGQVLSSAGRPLVGFLSVEKLALPASPSLDPAPTEVAVEPDPVPPELVLPPPLVPSEAPVTIPPLRTTLSPPAAAPTAGAFFAVLGTVGAVLTLIGAALSRCG